MLKVVIFDQKLCAECVLAVKRTLVRLVNTFRRLRASGAKAYLMFARLRINTNSEFTFYQTDNQNLNKNFENQCC